MDHPKHLAEISDMQCFWCSTDSESSSRDHLIPYSLGGTLDFSVASCSKCQAALSKAEHEVSRKSNLAFHALSSPVSPRHPDRPTSGNLKPSYLLVRHPLGGYGETLLSAGDKVRALAHLEIQVQDDRPFEGRVRGPSAEEAQRLLDTLRKALRLNEKIPPGEFVCELKATLKLDPEIASDPDFWPRVVLLPGDRLVFRARNPEEMTRLAKAIEFVARSNYQVDPTKWGDDCQIVGGTEHRIELEYDPQCVRRVAAKIAYGLFCALANRRLQSEDDQALRRYILGWEDSPDEPVSNSPGPEKWTTSSEPHFVVLSPSHDRTAGFVCFYGTHFFRAEMGPSAVLEEPLSVLCASDGSGMRTGTSQETLAFTEQIRSKEFGQEWKL